MARPSRDPCILLLRDLVAIDSVNPTLVPGANGEGAIAAAIADHMRQLGLEVTVQDVAPGRPNVIGVLNGDRPGPSLMLCGHVDTVGVEGMRDPFDPIERDGRLYGRGSQDMKGGVAAMIDAARVAAARGFSAGRLIVAAVVDEEYASLGADAVVTAWSADMAVVTEPTDLKIGIGHRGFAWIDVITRGRAAHGSRPVDGRDAIMRMGRGTWTPGSPRQDDPGAPATSGDGHRLTARVAHQRWAGIEQLSGPMRIAVRTADDCR